MYMVLMALLAVGGGWVAWRKNPLFSVRSTLRFILTAAAMLAAFIFAELAAIKYTAHFSEAVQLGAIFGVVGVGTIAMIGGIIKLSLPKGEPLPPSAKMVNIFRKRTHIWAKRLACFLLTFAVLVLVLRGAPQIVVGTIGGLFAFLGIVMLFAAWLTAKKTDRWLSAVEADPWAHWTYTPEQWRQWTEIEVQRAAPVSAQMFQWRRDWKKVVPTFAVMIFVPPLFFPECSWTERLVIMGVSTSLLVVGVALGNCSKVNAPASLRKKLVKANPEVYFGQDGLFADGEFTPWLTAGVYLHSAFRDEREPRSIMLQFHKIIAGSGSMTTVTTNVNLPLPQSNTVEADLARLQRELSAKCTQAAVALA